MAKTQVKTHKELIEELRVEAIPALISMEGKLENWLDEMDFASPDSVHYQERRGILADIYRLNRRLQKLLRVMDSCEQESEAQEAERERAA